jgi:hypothetical protein
MFKCQGIEVKSCLVLLNDLPRAVIRALWSERNDQSIVQSQQHSTIWSCFFYLDALPWSREVNIVCVLLSQDHLIQPHHYSSSLVLVGITKTTSMYVSSSVTVLDHWGEHSQTKDIWVVSSLCLWIDDDDVRVHWEVYSATEWVCELCASVLSGRFSLNMPHQDNKPDLTLAVLRTTTSYFLTCPGITLEEAILNSIVTFRDLITTCCSTVQHCT